MEITSKKTTKLHIPHPYSDPNCSIVGILEQTAPVEPTQGRKIALILHGTLGHKDYLFQKRLALRLPIDSFRFDFRGNFETPGSPKQDGLDDDVVDIQVAVDYLITQFGYAVDLIVGHSRGSVVGMRWMCISPEAKYVRGYVNVSGRYRMNKIYDGITPMDNNLLNTQGYYERQERVARQDIVMRVTKEGLEEFANFDTSLVKDKFPVGVDILTLQGTDDKVVPPFVICSQEDANIYANIFSRRSLGTHNIHLIEGADHNFTGLADKVVVTILEWYEMLDRKTLRTGIWRLEANAKL